MNVESIMKLLLVILVTYLFNPAAGFSSASNVSLVCEEDNLPCRDGLKCYMKSEHCDQFEDCDDRSDEADCIVTCADNEFYCPLDMKCLSNMYRCDGTDDCPDGIDEFGCPSTECALANEFRCVSDGQCINVFLVCDGIPHCHDESDEQNCIHGCNPETEIDCYGNGTECVAMEKQCNGVVDCGNGEDEASDLCFSPTTHGVSQCSIHNGNCAHHCVDNDHGYHCECDAGFAIGPDHRTCHDIDECLDGLVCSQRCENNYSGYNCSCYDGYMLTVDKHSCVVANGIDPKLLIVDNGRLIELNIRDKSQHVWTFSDAVLDVDYSYATNKLFYIDSHNHSINVFSLVSGNIEQLVAVHLDTPTCLAYDWIHNNLYWADSGLHSARPRATINVVTLSTASKWRRTVLNETMVQSPNTIVVDPRANQGYLYWSQSGSKSAIYRSPLDGAHRLLVADYDVFQPTGLTLDFLGERLLWIDSRLLTLNSWSLNTRRRQVLFKLSEYPHHPAGLAIIEDWIYWSDEMTRLVYKVHKTVREELVPEIETVASNLSMPHDVTVFHALLQPEGDSYCGTNHGCSHICLPSPTFARHTCLCPDGDRYNKYKLSEDAKTCVHSSAVLPTATQRSLTSPPLIAKSVRPDVTRVSWTKTTRPSNNAAFKPTAPTSASSDGVSPGGQGDVDTHTATDGVWVPVVIGIIVLVALIAIVVCVGLRIYKKHVLHKTQATLSTRDINSSLRVPLAPNASDASFNQPPMSDPPVSPESIRVINT